MTTKKDLVRTFLVWIPFAVVISLVCTLVYTTGQQILRMAANDPQIQMAEDISDKKMSGLPIAIIVSPQKIDLSKSLSPFVIVYTDDGQPIFSTASLNGQTPTLPSGVFQDAKNKQLRFTWQPTPGVRTAAVINHFDGKNSGYVLVGRSLREVEIREDQLLQEVTIGWFISLVVLYIALFTLRKINV